MKSSPTLLRLRDDEEAKVSFVELFFDLVYVYAVTQISHQLLHQLDFTGFLQTAILWLAVWLGWQYTSWVTNWFNPEHLSIRLLLMGLMALALVMSVAIGDAFGTSGLLFACIYAAIQVGRTLFVLASLPKGHALAPNFQRMLCWLLLSAALWIAGGFLEGEVRLLLWALAVLCEFGSPLLGFSVPGLGRSYSSEWTLEGGHFAERCQLFVIIALGESVMATGTSLASAQHPSALTWLAFAVSFLGCLAMWWMYFDTSSKDGSHVIAHSDDPGKLGTRFGYVHVLLVAGVIVCAVADDLIVAHPQALLQKGQIAALIGGPALYLLGNAFYKKVVYGKLPLSHLTGLILLLVLLPLSPQITALAAGSLTTAVMVMVAAWSGYQSSLSGNQFAAKH